MANIENLKNGVATRFQTGEEQVKIARKGGIRSGEVRRENKLIRERILERMGENDWDAMVDGLIQRAQESDKAFEILRDTIGQKPTEQIELSSRKESQNKLDEMLGQLWDEQ